MSSVVKPLTATSQNSTASNQVTKTMHPQGTTTSYNQPAHVPQSLGNIHTNTNVAHNHQNQQHHYSLNVPNTSGHYSSQNMGIIPVSNHPVANPSATAAGQSYSPQKNVTNFSTNYQGTVAHQQSANVFPTINQPGTASQQNVGALPQNAVTSTPQGDKAHSNGTSDAKSPLKPENQDNFLVTSKEKNVQPTLTSQVQDKQTLAKPADVPESKPATPPSSLKTSPVLQPCEPPVPASSPAPTTAEIDKVEEAACEETEEGSKVSDNGIVEPELEEATTPTTTAEPENLTKTPESFKDAKPELGENRASPTADAADNKVNPDQNSQKESSAPKQSPVATTNTAATPKPPRSVKSTVRSNESVKKEPKTPTQKSPGSSKAKRQRNRTQHYQSPLPEVELISKISTSTPRSTDERLIVFYRNEFLAVRNAEGSFYLCQAVQNIYKSSSKIKIRWLSLDKNDKTAEIYTPDFYDLTDFDCILTNLNLNRVDKGKFRLPPSEKDRTQSILNRSLAVEKGEVTSPSLTEEHPDGLDLSLYRDEDQLKKRASRKRKVSQKRSKSLGKKNTATKKTPETPKARKVAETPKVTKKAPVAKKTVAGKKAAAVPEPESKKPATSSRSTSRTKAKVAPKTSFVVDQKKAKVLAKIGRKAVAAAAAVKPVSANNKNAKSRAKPAAAAAPSASKKAAAKVPPPKPQPRNVKRSTRK